MMDWSAYFFLPFFLLGNIPLLMGKKEDECLTSFRFGPPCIFPFRLNGELFFECTTQFLKNSTEAMCPVRGVNPATLEASENKDDWGVCNRACRLLDYRNNEELFAEIKELGSAYPDLALPFIIGSSVRGQPLVGIRLSNNVRARRESLKPMVRLVANSHGNEAVGRELLLHMAYHLLQGYRQDVRIKRLLDTTDISLLPSLNPDGWDSATKGDCNGNGKKHGMFNQGNVDLNRNFPTLADRKRFDTDLEFSVYDGREPETAAMLDWSARHPFVLSADLHDGAVLVTYPFDFQLGGVGSVAPNLTPDQDIFIHLASGYVDRHKTMKNLTTCFRKTEGGMANGAEWLAKSYGGASQAGSLKDFSYLFTNTLEISLDLTCCKFPTRFFLLREWENNKASLLNFLEQVHMGVKGIVFGPDGEPKENADIVVWNPDGSMRKKNVTSYATGEYWKVLLPGASINTGESSYRIQAFYDDCDGTGRRYASLEHRVLVSNRTPLVTQLLFLRHIGFCGIPTVEPQTRARPNRDEETAGAANDIQLQETPRAQASNSPAREVPAAHVARPEALPKHVGVTRPGIVSFPNRISVEEAKRRKPTSVTSSPIQGVSALFSAEVVEDDEQAVDVDEIFLRAIDIRL